jgi:nucleotide-binding universal stress UspA family protein
MTSPIKRVLLYVDGSEESVTAAQYAIMLCKSLNAELKALYVVNTKALQDLLKSRIFIESETQEYQQDLKGDAERYLSHVQKLARMKGLLMEIGERDGAIYKEIKAEVKEGDYDLLIIGKHSGIRTGREEMYNDVERAARMVGCSVLYVKDEDRVDELFEIND